MAQHRWRGFPSITMPCLPLAQLAVTALMLCAASTTTGQPQTLPLPMPQPQPAAAAATAPAAPAVPSQLPAPCPPAQVTLAPCLRFFTGGNSSWSPPAECCAQIRAMFQSQAPCLCAAMASGPAAQLGGLGSALGQLLPTSCDLPADACSGTTTTTSSGGAPADPATGSGGATAAAAAPETGAPTGADTTAAGGGGAGVKSVPGLLGSTGSAAPGSRGFSAAAAGLFVWLLGVYLL
ncbi:unnamed protein product [Urochloa humidicola]